VAREPWPKHGPDFNRWNGGLARLVALLENPENQGFWCHDWGLKYLSIWVDTRDAGFVLKDRDGNVIQPERVEDAIAKWRAM